jgi:hypothetical protein
MIVAHIIGGLGNQMFQLATGKALATRLGVELQLDTTYFDRARAVEFDLGLHRFGHGCREARPSSLPPMRMRGLASYIGGRLTGRGLNIFHEKATAYDPAFETLGDDTFLHGYWQSEKYFRGYADVVRQALTFVTPPSSENQNALDGMENCLPVSLHTRRGDYVTNPKFNAVLGTCDLDYYQRAAIYLAENTEKEPVFYAFSDDPDWVRENLKLPFEIRYMNHNGAATNYEDIRLMSACHHHILANSSFSWWGAWLNPRSDKVVIAPKRWFADPGKQVHDIILQDWITL